MAVGWRELRLGDVCELRYGKSLPKAKRSGEGFAVFGSNGQIGRHGDALTAGKTIIVGRKGSLGEVTFSYDPCWAIDTTYYIDESATTTDLRWLYYRMKAMPLTRLNRAAAVPGLNREDAYSQPLLLPPIEEQRRIAAVLDAVDALRAKRRLAITKLDSLTQAIFIDMFDDGKRDGWETSSVANLAAPARGSIRTGPFGSQLLHEEFVEEGPVAVLGIDNAVKNHFAWGEKRFISAEKYEQLKRYTVKPGDVLVTIMGTCGRTAIVPDDIPLSINTKHLCCITLDQDRCIPEFLWACLRFHPAVLTQLGATRGAVMPGLNMGLIKRARIPVPPIEMQERFARLKKRAEHQMKNSTAHHDYLDALLASLQQRAFRGEL